MAARRLRWPSFAMTGERRFSREVLHGWWNAIEPLWSVGLAVICLLIGHLVLTGPWLDLQGKSYDWGQYVVIGVVYPALLLGIPLLWQWRGWSTTPVVAVKRVLAVACLVMFVVFVAANVDKYGPREGLWPVVGLAALQVILMTRPWRREGVDPKRLAVTFVVAFVAWTVSVSLFLYVYVQPPVFLAGFALAFLLVCGALADPDYRWPVARARIRTPANLAALALLGLMSLRTDHLFEVLGDRGAIHHWGAWVGAADLVREGGWLLWDAPSNYGFLNVLVFAVVPTDTPWQSFYLLTALALFGVSAGLFLTLRSIRNGPLNWCFALAIAIAVPMFGPGLVESNPVTSTFIFPNAGAYRYIWAFVLVAILVWEDATEEGTRRQRRILLLGNAAWLAGVLWSPESAFFCSGAWLPAYVMIVFRMTASSRNRWGRAAAWLAVPPAFLAAAIGFMMAFYAIRLGHLPDWTSFLDYAQEVGLNVLVVENEPIGPALGMLLGFCLLAIGAVSAGTRRGVPARSFGLWIGLLGAFWATNSYGFQRGSAMLHPVAYAALVLMLVLMARQQRPEGWHAVVRAGMAPLLVIVLASPFAAVVNNPLAVQDVAASLASTARDGFAVEPLLPDADPSLQALMAEAGVRPGDPIVFFGDYLGNLLQPWIASSDTEGERVIVTPHWLPGHPSLALRWIPPGRGAVYTSRFIERTQLSGWMIQRKTGLGSGPDLNAFVSGREPWLFDLLHRTHVPTSVHENADWQLTWWEYVGDRSEIARPSATWSLFAPLPPDVVVDGQPLAGTSHPTVWTRFGDGWGVLDPAIGGRPAVPGATLWIYSPEPRAATVRLTTTSATERRRSVELDTGWNRITFPGEGMILVRLEIDTR